MKIQLANFVKHPDNCETLWNQKNGKCKWQIIQENDWEARSTAVHLVGDAQVANLEAWNENSQEFAHKK